ncbi:biopolymer transporter ExbD [Asticcacaulis sp. EMRT-3]|uniref:ExbD/TolR family protein n=1 Tax=Asticcacaulis sp. EMRT-3 TaxID=3040349 RepID=UPI0024AEDBFF|nr:biopolymer transporter ExbD [Asticcacaulis sp. EMRT-3]MDI7775284.1 biopolymer transporter ExbD [Asticcacaulis sp. EMRT-3]
MAMGASGAGGGGGGRRSNRRLRRRAALSEINVTPLVDVMLVLLIIFMISAPLLTSGIKIQLPKTEAAALKDEGDPLTVSIDEKGNLFVNDDPASYAQLTPRLLAITNGETDKPVYVRAAGAASYDIVAKVMARLSTSGFVKINLLTETMSQAQGQNVGQTVGASSAVTP